MATIGLKKEVLKKISSDPILFGKVAHTLGVVPGSLARLLNENHSKLTQAAVLVTIKDHIELSGEEQSIEDLYEKQASEEVLR